MELYVLGEAHDLAALFPAVRPRDAVFDAFAERAAAALDPAKPLVPIGLMEQGLALLDEDERRRIVESWSLVYPDRWAPLLEDGGCEPLICRAVVCGAVRIAILERCPVPAAAFTLYEGGLHPQEGAFARSTSRACALLSNGSRRSSRSLACRLRRGWSGTDATCSSPTTAGAGRSAPGCWRCTQTIR